MVPVRFFQNKIIIILFILNILNFAYFYRNSSTLALTDTITIHDSVRVPYIFPTTVIIDGSIDFEEYPNSFEDPTTKISAFFTHDGENIYVGLRSTAHGWLSIGFGPLGIGMDESNIIIGYVKDGITVLEDHTGEGLSHYNDSHHVGSTNDIIDFAGTENNSYTTIEFIFPLSSGDHHDHNFIVGETYGFFLANHETADDLTTIHRERSDSLPLVIELSSVLFPRVAEPLVTIDGTVAPNEYELEFIDPITKIKVYFEHNSTDMFVGLVSNHTGWLSIGFGPSNIGMNGSNIIIGYVSNSGILTIDDFYGIPDNHTSDTSDGGTNDIKESAGTEENGITTIEFIFPLNSSDSDHDHNFTLGETYGFFVSHHPTADDFVSEHYQHSATIDLYINILEKITTSITLTVTDESNNILPSGSDLSQESTITISATLSLNKDLGDYEKGTLINLNINSSLGGMMKINSNFTNSVGIVYFSYHLSHNLGEIEFIVDFPITTSGTIILSSSQASFRLNVVSTHEEEPSFLDNPQIFELVSIGIVIAAGAVFLTYLYVFFNAGRIFQRSKN